MESNSKMKPRNILICPGCDFLLPIIVQEHFTYEDAGVIADWFQSVDMGVDSLTVDLSIFTNWEGNKHEKDIIEVFSAIPGKFGELTADRNMLGISGKFSCILLENDIVDNQTDYCLGIHIPNNITNKFKFTSAYYELKLHSNDSNKTQLLAYGTMDTVR